MLTCHDIARYFLAITDEETGELISNLKLQKLVYYAQGYYLAKYKKPLFNEVIKAWRFGPVIPELYIEYKKYGHGSIPLPKNVDFSIYDEVTQELLDEVYLVFGQYSAWKLSELTHDDFCWQGKVGKIDNVITHQAMREHFEKLLNHHG